MHNMLNLEDHTRGHPDRSGTLISPTTLRELVWSSDGKGIYIWYMLGPLVPVEHCLNSRAYTATTTVFCFQHSIYPVTKLKSSETGLLNITMSTLCTQQSTILQDHQMSIQLRTFRMCWNRIQ